MKWSSNAHSFQEQDLDSPRGPPGFSCAEKCSYLELETCLQLSWDPSLVCFNLYSIRASAMHSVGSDAVNMQLFCSLLDMFGISATQTTYVAGFISCPLTTWTYFQSEIYPIKVILQILVHFWKIFQNPVLPCFLPRNPPKKNDPHPKVWRHLTEFARSSDLDTKIRWITGVTVTI